MKSFILFLTLTFSTLCFSQTIDYAQMETELTTTGLGGWVHGNFKKESLFVFTWRDPNNFFVNTQLPLIGKTPVVTQKLQDLKRHDFVIIKGVFSKNKAPLKHIYVTEIIDIQKWTGPGSDLDYTYYSDIPNELFTQKEIIGKVHAVIANGNGLVIEYKDVVIPVFNILPDTAKDLFRNDKIKLKYIIQDLPLQPNHLNLDTTQKNPLEVLERIESGHGSPITLSGPLVMFPQSPQIKFNVYALRVSDSDFVTWNYTVVNFENTDLFLELRQKLETAWEKHKSFAEYDRNKFINRKIIVTITGTKNVISPDQANPQILVNSVDDIIINFKK